MHSHCWRAGRARDSGDLITLLRGQIGSGNDDHLWQAGYGSGGWSAQQLAIGRSHHGQALGRVDNRIVMVWKGANGDERLWWTPDNFRTQLLVRDGYTSSNTPTVVALNFADL